MILYKYCDLRGIDILKNCRLKVTPPGYFNDLMEWTWVEDTSDDPHSSWDHWRYPQRHQYFLESFNALLGLICFSETPDSLLMWSHYAANHTGLVFGFDTSKFPAMLRDSLAPVDYSREKVKWDRNWEQDKKDRMSDKLCLTKAIDWAYEKEWRAILRLDHCTQQRIGIWKRRTFHFASIPADSIVRVIMGARCQFRVFRKLMWHGLKLENRVPFERAKLDPEKYQLRFGHLIDPRLENIEKHLTNRCS